MDVNPNGSRPFLQTRAQIRHLRTQSIDALLQWFMLRARAINRGSGMGLILLLQALGFRLHFLLEQIPFLPEPIWCILRQHCHLSSCIGKTMADASAQAIDGGADESV